MNTIKHRHIWKYESTESNGPYFRHHSRCKNCKMEKIEFESVGRVWPDKQPKVRPIYKTGD